MGKEYLSEEGTLDRAKVAERIFHDKEALKAVEAIIHKIVWQQAESFWLQAANRDIRQRCWMCLC